ncbi:hypothetical protein V6N13_118572 [Hibiscus sabdariffa]
MLTSSADVSMTSTVNRSAVNRVDSAGLTHLVDSDWVDSDGLTRSTGQTGWIMDWAHGSSGQVGQVESVLNRVETGPGSELGQVHWAWTTKPNWAHRLGPSLAGPGSVLDWVWFVRWVGSVQ